MVEGKTICQNCQANVQDWPFCPYCGYSLKGQAEKLPQELDPHSKPGKRAGRRGFLRRWVMPFVLLLVIILFGILGLALAGLRAGERERAVATRHQAEIHYNRGLVYLNLEQYRMAEIEFEEALRLAPDYTEAKGKWSIACAQQTVTPTATPLPSPTPTATSTPAPTPTARVVLISIAQALFEEGRKHYTNEDWEAAISDLERLRSEDTTYHSSEALEMLFESHRQYGLQLEEQGSLEEAITHYDSALSLRRRDAEVEELRQRADLYIRALSLWNIDWERAIVNLTALHALAPDYRDTADRLYQACIVHAKALVKQERYCHAADLLNQALAIQADDAEIVKLADDAHHLCKVVGTTPAEIQLNGVPTGTVHIGTLVATCYDHRTNQYSICGQNVEDSALHTWLTQAEQPALTLDGAALAYRSTDPEHPGLYAAYLVPSVPLTSTSAVTPATGSTASVTLTAGTPFTIATDATASYPTWSPDGKRLAYTQYDEKEQEWFIYIAQVDRPEESGRIYRGEWPKWGPNGLLAFTTCTAQDKCGIHTFDPATRELRRVTASIQDRAAAWSPSGKEIAYMNDIGRSFNLCVVVIESSTVRQITRNLVQDGMPVWSPDGQRIAFVTNRNDHWSVYTLHPFFGTQVKQIAALGAESADWLRFQLAWVAPVIRFAPAQP